MQDITPLQLRRRIRSGEHRGPTSGWCDDYLQGNLVILPAALADQFEAFCAANSAPLPLLARGAAGEPSLPTLGKGIDIRTDVSRYCVFEHGVHVAEVTNLHDYWRADLVTFVLGCSFSFEAELQQAGIPMRHQHAGRNVAMYTTTRTTEAVGPFNGALVVSMRAFPAEHLDAVQEICARHPLAHGQPIHAGDPIELGITHIMRPDYGDAPIIEAGDICVFWACGVTGQEAVRAAKPEIAITHSPGHMLLTDLPARVAYAGSATS